MRRATTIGRGFGVVAAAVSVVAYAEPVAADNWGSTNTDSAGSSVSLGGGSSPLTHSISFHDVTLMRQATRDALQNVYGNGTQLSTQVNPDGGSADVKVFEDTYGLNGAYAWVNCPPGATVSGAHPMRRCFNQVLKYNGSYAFDAMYATPAKRKYLACHELGHSVGLRHAHNGNHPAAVSSCMIPPALGNLPQSIHGHDADLVNALH